MVIVLCCTSAICSQKITASQPATQQNYTIKEEKTGERDILFSKSELELAAAREYSMYKFHLFIITLIVVIEHFHLSLN